MTVVTKRLYVMVSKMSFLARGALIVKSTRQKNNFDREAVLEASVD